MGKIARPVHNPWFSKRKESRSGSNRGPSAYLPNALPLAHNGSHYLYLSCHRYILPPFHIWFTCQYSEAHYTIIAKILYSQCLVVHLDVAFHFHTINLKILLDWSHFYIYHVWNFTKMAEESTWATTVFSFDSINTYSWDSSWISILYSSSVNFHLRKNIQCTAKKSFCPVSYTHLTLPTRRTV